MKHSSRRIFWHYHLPVILYMIGIFILSSLPGLTPPDLGFEPQDKLYHFVFYATFGFFIAGSLFYQNRFPYLKRRYILFTVIFGSFYGFSDEVHQYFVPGRMMSVWDFVADSLGVLAAAWIFHFRCRIRSCARKAVNFFRVGRDTGDK